MRVPWKHASLVACLGQLSISLFLWFTARGAVGHVAAPELPSKEGRAQSPGTRGGSGAHLCREVWSVTTAYVTARGCTR
jgi:hypothetical protein